jgi:hypothetical protein
LQIDPRRATFAGVTSEELHAAAATRRELGRDYDEAILLSLAERLERKRRRPSALREAATIVMALGSIGLGVLVALAAGQLGELGATFATIVAWICIAVINVVYARSR